MYLYPRKNFCKAAGAKIFILKKEGHSNYISYLKFYVSHGNINYLYYTYFENFKLKQTIMGEYFELVISITEKEKKLITWVKLSLKRVYPLISHLIVVLGHLDKHNQNITFKRDFA